MISPAIRRSSTSQQMKPKILIVDDEPDVVQLIEYNLKSAGYDVMTSTDGQDALQQARASSPDLIILDLMLPEVDGLDVCKVLRRDTGTAGIPIVMLTAKASETDRVLGLELGADDYVTKPFSPRELVLRVKRLLRSESLIRAMRSDSSRSRTPSAMLLKSMPCWSSRSDSALASASSSDSYFRRHQRWRPTKAKRAIAAIA